jgi:hypothetical protein
MNEGFSIRRATRGEIEAFLDDCAEHADEADAAVLNGRIIAMGGFSTKGSRRFVFLNFTGEARRYGYRITRALLRRLRARGETVFIQCDGDYADRFLRFLGFTPTDEMMTDMRDGITQLRVYQWQSSQR